MLKWLKENKLTLEIRETIDVRLSDKECVSKVQVQLMGDPKGVTVVKQTNLVIAAQASEVKYAVMQMMGDILGETIFVEVHPTPWGGYDGPPLKVERSAEIKVPKEMKCDDCIAEIIKVKKEQDIT